MSNDTIIMSHNINVSSLIWLLYVLDVSTSLENQLRPQPLRKFADRISLNNVTRWYYNRSNNHELFFCYFNDKPKVKNTTGARIIVTLTWVIKPMPPLKTAVGCFLFRWVLKFVMVPRKDMGCPHKSHFAFWWRWSVTLK